MEYTDENSSISAVLNLTTKFKHYKLDNDSVNPVESVFIAFQISFTISTLCCVFGLPGNLALILTILRSSLSSFPYGLLLSFLAIFDTIRLLSQILYFFIRGHVIPLTLTTSTIYIVSYRYPRFVTNWLKVFLAVERLIAVKYWIEHRYNIHSDLAKRSNHKRQKKLLLLILVLLCCALISQHPNFFSKRFSSIHFDPQRLLMISVPNRSFYYGNQIFNGILYTIISYIIIDDFLPIVTLVICNTILLYELRHLPKLTSRKLSESILILFLLTVFSLFILPKSFLVIFNLYTDQTYVSEITIAVITHTFQGLEMVNYAVTGYACFFSCRTLRKDFFRNIQILTSKLQRTKHRSNPSMIELSSIPREYP